jgi:hypothetical protein
VGRHRTCSAPDTHRSVGRADLPPTPEKPHQDSQHSAIVPNGWIGPRCWQSQRCESVSSRWALLTLIASIEGLAAGPLVADCTHPTGAPKAAVGLAENNQTSINHKGV